MIQTPIVFKNGNLQAPAEFGHGLYPIMSKLNLISDKFSAAQPIIKKKFDDKPLFDQDVLDKVDLIRRLKKM